MGWRRYNAALHRDLGYTFAALTIAYAISGVAVNHIEDWNPSYAERKEHLRIAPIPEGSLDAAQAFAREKLGLKDPPRGRHAPDDATLQLFYEGRTYSIDRPTGNVILEEVRPRPVLREMNDLHLNTLKGAWTYVADAFALALLIMAVSGVIMLRGRAGFFGRGKWFVAAGVLVPLAFLLYQRYR